MIVITGAAGFIGSCFASFLNERGYHDLVLVDDFSRAERSQNYETKQFTVLLDRELFPAWLQKEANQVQAVIHLGARTDTTEKNHGIFQKLILEYSQRLWQVCSEAGIPFLYASSAATYGNGNQGFVDSEETLRHLQPLNPYGQAKHDFDLWVIEQKQQPPFWAGFKFFNVYGPNEYHKKRMASVIFHAFHQIRSSGKLRLFRSHNPNYADGGQMRDFVYVKDVCKVLFYFLTGRKANGIYNLGSGKA
ncbi:MAG: NAD-dependent epimerase/dehydratase family protein, partial [Bacteroidia bacterium]|nr:NAD-dependent epimerase/dehydratase family protein [Bacteroidia bacterium]